MLKTVWILFFFLLFPGLTGCEEKQDKENDGGNIPANYKVRSVADAEALASLLKSKILESETSLSCTGISYYVSNRGNDGNSGRTPAEAWETLSKVSGTGFNQGDVVYFERGGLWRGSLLTKAGVGYSAYGKGIKPRIYGSLRNYSDKSKWKKTDQPNIYVYEELLEKDAGILVFNDGEAHTVKKVIGIDGFTGNTAELKNDLEMYHDVNDKMVYLFSESGNPADRFSSIEFCLKDHIIKTSGNNIRIDNLCIKYGGAHGIGSGPVTGLRVTNCEFGWIGGSIQFDKTRYGNAIEIYGSCRDYFVDHCYIYQIYDAGITHQYKNPTSTETRIMENVIYSNNLIEYCIYSIEYFLNQPNSPNDIMKNIFIRDNICRLSGYGWGWQRPNKAAMNIQGWRSRNPAENFIIEGNIFDRSKDRLIMTGAINGAHLPEFRNNIYIQNRGGKFGFYGPNDSGEELIFDEGIKERIVWKGIDKSPTIIFAD